MKDKPVTPDVTFRQKWLAFFVVVFLVISPGIVAATFASLKLAGLLGFSWRAVASPILIPAASALAFFVTALIQGITQGFRDPVE